MDTYFTQLQTAFEHHANPSLAFQMKKYMRNQFDFYGIPSPKRKEIIRDISKLYILKDKNEFIEFLKACWLQPQREFKYVAMDSGVRQLKRMDESYIEFFEKLIAIDSWWDTVDGLAPQIIGSLIQQNIHLRSHYCNKWIESTNFWCQRSAIILQLHYKKKTDFELLKSLILRRADSKEFFVQKASGWALRHYSRIDPKAVEQFILENKLSSLTTREGLRFIRKKSLIIEIEKNTSVYKTL